jgi:vacuolar protein sorting-associated protein 13A/C
VKQLGMSLIKMDKPQDAVRFMDETDMNLIVDRRVSIRECQTVFEFNSKPITFRASYRDINLITSIANKALALSKPIPASDVSVIGPKRTNFSKERSTSKYENKFSSERQQALLSREKASHDCIFPSPS